MAEQHPPRLARWLLRSFLPSHIREFVTGDLDEEFRRYVTLELSPRQARHWYWSQTLRSLANGTAGPPKKTPQSFQKDHAGKTMMTTLMQDIRYAFRAFARTPGQMGLIVITLGLGIGATTAIFSAVNEVMLRPLSFADPDRLVMLRTFGKSQIRHLPAR